MPRPTAEAFLLAPSGDFPNNPTLPALHYRAAFELPRVDPAARIEHTFARHAWTAGWRDGVYPYHHFHSTAHEVLGCYAGRAQLQLGGPDGPILELSRGDALVLPAGVAHKRIDASADFSVVGAYAGGRAYDMQRGNSAAASRIAAVPLPEQDPVHGAEGPLFSHWRR